MSKVICPCSAEVGKTHDGKSGVIYAECYECVANKGDFTKSSSWIEQRFDPPKRLDTGSSDGVVLPFPKTAKGAKSGKRKISAAK